MVKKLGHLVDDMKTKGGALVLSDHCSAAEIASAKAEGRFGTLPGGLGLVRCTASWLECLTPDEVTFNMPALREKAREVAVLFVLRFQEGSLSDEDFEGMRRILEER